MLALAASPALTYTVAPHLRAGARTRRSRVR
jgi:hypothetical protein